MLMVAVRPMPEAAKGAPEITSKVPSLSEATVQLSEATVQLSEATVAPAVSGLDATDARRMFEARRMNDKYPNAVKLMPSRRVIDEEEVPIELSRPRWMTKMMRIALGNDRN